MAFIDINKLTTIEECDRIILLLIREGYKKYLEDTKQGQIYLSYAINIMNHSAKIKKIQTRKEKIKQSDKEIKEDE